MATVTVCKKRPCRICRRWFRPHARLKDRQKTCGDPACQKEWHRRTCARWNKDNGEYFKEIYLDKKLKAEVACRDSTGPLARKSRFPGALPREIVQEVIGTQHLIIIEYFGQLLLRRVQEALRAQPFDNTG